MPEFQVLMEKVTSESVWIDVEAPDQETADCKALELVNADSFDLDEYNVGIWEEDWKVDKSFRCLDCGICTSANGEYPLMIRDELWYQIVPGGEGMLCRADMERRLGRPLTQEDLIPLPNRRMR
jgi:hypothetical protein